MGNLDEVIELSFYVPWIDGVAIEFTFIFRDRGTLQSFYFPKKRKKKNPLSGSRLPTPREMCCQEVGGSKEISRAWTAPEV